MPNKIKIGVLPGSSNNSEKRWPVSNWITLIKETLRVSRISKIALYGSEHEIDLSNLIVKDINDPGLENKCGKTNLEQLCIELSSCSVVVGNDSGGMHLANCLGVPSLVIFGPTNPNATRPIYGTNMSLIRTDFKHSAAELDKVMEALLRILNS